MAISDRIVSLTQSRNTLRNKMVAAGQATSNDKLEVLVENLTIDSSGDGISIKVITNEESKYGKTVTISQGTKTYTSVFSDTGEAAFGSVDFQNGTIIVTCEGAYSEFEITVDYELYLGFTYKDWLKAGDIIPEEYSSLDEVLADEKAIRKLMTLHSSVDYLASFSAEDVNIVTILTDDYCAKWINLRDYALDTLYANEEIKALMDEADKYGYGEWALMPQVPTMTSNTAPYGEAFASSEYASKNAAWKVFEGIKSTTSQDRWSAGPIGNGYIGYHFVNPKIIKQVRLQGYSDTTPEGGTQIKDFQIEASNDNTKWDILYSGVYPDEISSKGIIYTFDNNVAYSYYRINILNTYSPNNWVTVLSLQFYAWGPKGNVPVMTSNTAPWGTLTTDYSPYASTAAYRMFDDNETTQYYGPTSGDWLHYTHKLVNPLCIKRIKFRTVVDTSGTLVLKGSNDGSNYVELLNKSLDKQTMFHDYNIDTDQYYLYYYFEITGSNRTPEIYTMQYYGRELKVSVPKMTSNTAPWGAIEASSFYGGYLPYYPFDRSWSSGHGWITASGKTVGEWIQYNFRTPKVIKLIRIYNTVNYWPTSITLLGSDNGTSFDDIQSFENYGTNGTDVVFNVENDDAYSILRIRLDDGYGPYYGFHGLQFYCLDYSEYDWDEDNPRHYVYDHGVMVDSNGFTYDSNTNFTTSKEPDHIYISGAGNGSHGLMCQVDFTNYSLIRAVLGLEKMTFSLATELGVKTAKDSTATPLALNKFNNIGLSDLRYNSFVDVSSINEIHLAYCGHTSNNGYTDQISIQELWLE